MKIHHLNCSTLCPIGGPLMDGKARLKAHARLVCHCLLIESDRGLVLVDTGLGARDIQRPMERIAPFFKGLLRPKLSYEETALAQVVALGFSPTDVRHIVLTHLDFDHAGGIDGFPWARVHLMKDEREAALDRGTLIARRRYRPQQFAHSADWTVYSPQGESWFDFEAVRQLQGLPPEILLVPLAGHTHGHPGVAIHTNRGWLLHAGDAYFFHGEMAPEYHCTPGLRAYQRMMEVDRRLRLMNQMKLRELALGYGEQIKVFCAHDPTEFQDLKGSRPRQLHACDPRMPRAHDQGENREGARARQDVALAET